MSANHEDKEKWVDDLLAQVPAPAPIPDDISRQLDEFLVDHIAKLEAESNPTNIVSLESRRTTRFSGRYQILVAAAAVLGILTFAGTQTSFFSSNPGSTEIAAEPNESEVEPTPLPEENSTEQEAAEPTGENSTEQEAAEPTGENSTEQEAAEPTGESENFENGTEPTPTKTPEIDNSANQGNGGMVDPEVSSSEIQVLGSEGGTEYLPSNAPNVQITSSGMDYAKNLDAILDEIAPYGEPGKLNKLSNSQLACVIKFKLVDRVVAVDSGKYNGTSVVTFFAIADDGTTKAYISKPGNGCELVKRVSIN
jgi:hypothetical protein